VLDRFPVENRNRRTFDEQSFPLQALTHLGWAQALWRGRQLRRRYIRFLAANADSHFLASARASNFMRTQFTARAVLSGLLPDSAMPAVPIVVRPAAADFIAVYEAENDLAAFCQSVFSSRHYAEHEALMDEVALQLCNAFPFFAPSPLCQSNPATDRQTAVRSPSFQWIRAHDVLMCFRAHGLALPALISSEVESATHAHLAWRYRTLFSVPRVRGIAVSPLLKELCRCLVPAAGAAGATAVAEEGSEDCAGDACFRLLSGHDMTILPLLLALISASSRIFACFEAAGGGTQAWERIPGRADARQHAPWPRYASCLTLELYSREVDAAFHTACGVQPPGGNWVVYWTLHNDTPANSALLDPRQDSLDAAGRCPLDRTDAMDAYLLQLLHGTPDSSSDVRADAAPIVSPPAQTLDAGSMQLPPHLAGRHRQAEAVLGMSGFVSGDALLSLAARLHDDSLRGSTDVPGESW